MVWNAHLQLDYRLQAPRTVLRFSHDGPLRVLKSLYPEGDGICHSVLVHPPGGLVEGDTLDISVRVQPGAHALISTPGATRFYRSDAAPATQQVALTLEAGARLEWLPLETIAYPGCMARNHMSLSLAEGAELLAWDVCALGLPSTGQPFDRGSLHQRVHWPGHWREEGLLQGRDQRLMASAQGLGGQRCLGTLFLACGTAMTPARREALLEAVREVIGGHALAPTTGATCPNERVLVVRTLAPVVEPAMELFKQLWVVLRSQAWQLPGTAPRIWSV
jgi:urease accessory protein